MTSNPSLIIAPQAPAQTVVPDRRDQPASALTASVGTELSNKQVAVVRQLLSADDISLVAEMLNRYSHAERGRADPRTWLKTRDRAGLITELERSCKINPSLRQTAVYQRCYALASELFGRPATYGFDHAIFKQPGSDPVHWHQDQKYSRLDLRKQCLSFWIPLQNVSSVNGGMEYAIGHYQLLRHRPLHKGSHTQHIRNEDLPELSTISPQMRPGDVCIHTPLTLHRSHANNGDSCRAAWILQFNRYGFSRFFSKGNLYEQIRRLYVIDI